MAHRASGFSFLDVVDSSLWSDLSSDAQEFEAESWSLVVDPSFCSRQEKDVIKRQDVIFGKHLNMPLGAEVLGLEERAWTVLLSRPGFKAGFVIFYLSGLKQTIQLTWASIFPFVE